MTLLSLAARNFLAQQPSVTSLLAKSKSWDTWIFDENPLGAKIEGTSKAMVVLTEGRQWTKPNEHNNQRFPTLIVDIWADPTRNTDKSVQLWDAKTKIEKIHEAIKPFLHTVDLGGPNTIRAWGTAAEISAHTGVFIGGSALDSGPDFYPVVNGDGAWMGQYVYNVNVI